MSDDALIRDMTASDLPVVLAWRNDPDVRRFMYNQDEITLTDHRAWFAELGADAARHALIVELAGQPIGVVNLKEIQRGKVAEWGFYRVPGAPNGSGGPLGKAALDYAFLTLGLHKLCGEVLDYNEVSARYHERLGFQLEGRLRSHREVGGQYHDVLCFGLLRSEWRSIRRAK